MSANPERATGADLRALCEMVKDRYNDLDWPVPPDELAIIRRVEALSKWLESRFEVPEALGRVKDIDQLGLLT